MSRRLGGLAILACAFAAMPCSGSPSKSESGRDAKRAGPVSEAIEEASLSTGLIQSLVMDFSDQYTSAMGAALDDYIAAEPDPTKRVAARYWKVRYGAAAMTIASSHDPRTNLLDMAVFISAGKWAVDSYWIPKVFGEKSSRLSDVYRQMDEKIWRLAGRVLSLKQQADLHELIRIWERQNPRAHEVTDVRLRNLDGVHLSAFDDGMAARGILAGVRKLLSRVDNSLLYGERMMFCLERTPRIISQQTDLTLAQIGEAFPIATVKPDALADAVKGLPAMLQEGLDRNEGSLNTLLPQIGATLESANTLTASLDKTLLSVRELTEKAGGSALLHADPAALLKDANLALAHLDSSINGLNQLLEKTASGEIKAAEISRQIDAQTDRLMDAAFRRILILIGVFFGGVVVVLVVAHILFRRGGKFGPAV